MKEAGKVLTGKLDELRRDLCVLQPAQQRRGLCAFAGPIKPFYDDEGTSFWHGECVEGKVWWWSRANTRPESSALERLWTNLGLLHVLN